MRSNRYAVNIATKGGEMRRMNSIGIQKRLVGSVRLVRAALGGEPLVPRPRDSSFQLQFIYRTRNT
jgi:hypothetical protein